MGVKFVIVRYDHDTGFEDLKQAIEQAGAVVVDITEIERTYNGEGQQVEPDA